MPFQATDARFHLRLHPAPLPANDAFANAREVSVPGRYTGDLADATAELVSRRTGAAVKPARSVWFRFRARRTGRLSIQATSPGCLSPVGVYTGTRLDAVHRGGGSNGTVRFLARRGQTYRVAVDCAAAASATTS